MISILFIIIAYLLGSIPTSVWVGKRFYGIDVRKEGSKNAGATNTFRVLGKKPGIVVLVIDILKGLLAIYLTKWVTSSDSANWQSYCQILSAIAAVLGHMFPIFAQFKGGKGVATSFGVILGIYPEAAGICALVFLMVFIASQYVSLGAIVAAILFPILVTFIFHQYLELKIFSWGLSLLVIYKHKLNIKRLLTGSENKMNIFKKSS